VKKGMVSKTLLIASSAFLGALAVAAPALAQQPPSPPAGEQPLAAPPQPPQPVQPQPPPAPPAAPVGPFSRLDTNRDGMVDRMEYDAGAAAAFGAADRDNNGRLSITELGNALRGMLGGAVIERRVQPGPPGRRGQNPPNTAERRDRDSDDRDGRERAAPNRPQLEPRFRGPDDQRRFLAPYFGPRFQPPYWWYQPPLPPGFQAPYPPRFQAPVPPRFQAPGAPRRADPAPRNRDQAAPQGRQAPPAATPPGFAAIDRNRDGVISPEEFASAFGRGTSRR
jgi:hypothetical protein